MWCVHSRHPLSQIVSLSFEACNTFSLVSDGRTVLLIILFRHQGPNATCWVAKRTRAHAFVPSPFVPSPFVPGVSYPERIGKQKTSDYCPCQFCSKDIKISSFKAGVIRTQRELGRLAGKTHTELGPPICPCSKTEPFRKQEAWQDCTECVVMSLVTTPPET